MMLPLLAFAFGSLIVMAAAYALMPKRASAIDRRIEELTADRAGRGAGRTQGLPGHGRHGQAGR